MPTFSDMESEVDTSTCHVQQLEWRQENGLVVVTPRDKDRYVLRLHDVIEAMKMVAQKERFEQQFLVLQKLIAKWISEASGVSRAFLTVRDGSLCLVVVRTAIEYDDDFEDAVSELDLQVANDKDLNLIRMSSIALPNSSSEAIASFLNSDVILEYVHGTSNRPYPSGKQESPDASVSV